MQHRLFPKRNLPKNLVFSGGGVNIIGHAGAVVTLLEAGEFKEVEKVAGTSAGALIALLIMLKFTAKEIQDTIIDIDFKKFLGDNLPFEVMRMGYNLLTGWGAFPSLYLQKFIDKLIESKLKIKNATLADVQKYNPDMEYRAVTYNNSRKCTHIFSSRDSKELAADVVTASMSVPFVFNPTSLNKNPYTGKSDLCSDGASINNYCLHIFDETDPSGKRISNPHTLGFLLAEPEDVSWMKQNISRESDDFSGLLGFPKYALEIVSTILFRQKHELLRNSEDVARTVFIPICANPLNPLLDQATRHQAFQLGVAAAKERLNKKQELKEQKQVRIRSAL